MPTSLLLRAPALVFAACLLLVVAARLVGSAQPPPAALDALHLNDCRLPCWVGIEVGVTAFDDAIDRVRVVNPGGTFTSGYSSTVISAYQIGSPLGQVGVYADAAGNVAQLTLLTHKIEGITYGDVLRALGAPTCLLRHPASAVYASSTAFAVLIAGRGDNGWHAPLDHVEIRRISGNDIPCARLTQ